MTGLGLTNSVGGHLNPSIRINNQIEGMDNGARHHYCAIQKIVRRKERGGGGRKGGALTGKLVVDEATTDGEEKVRRDGMPAMRYLYMSAWCSSSSYYAAMKGAGLAAHLQPLIACYCWWCCCCCASAFPTLQKESKAKLTTLDAYMRREHKEVSGQQEGRFPATTALGTYTGAAGLDRALDSRPCLGPGRRVCLLQAALACRLHAKLRASRGRRWAPRRGRKVRGD
jgi:hypothetical protein